MSGLVDDILEWLLALKSARLPWEKAWRDSARVAMPMAGRMDFTTLGGVSSSATNALNSFVLGPSATERSIEIYDDTAVYCMDRLNSGIESLVTPRSQQWHGAGFEDAVMKETHDEKAWFERYVEYLFKTRYNPASGFELANQSAIRSATILGTGLYYVAEAFGGRTRDAHTVPASYSYTPVWQCYMDVSGAGEADVVKRCLPMSARNIVERWPDKCSQAVKDAANDPSRKSQRFEILHSVCPRPERGSRGNYLRDSQYAEYWCEVESKTLLDDGGAYEFPYGIYYWDQEADCPYGQSIVMASLGKIKSLNVMGKNQLKAIQQWTDPPTATMTDGSTNRPNLNPGKNNPGMLNERGDLKIKTLITALSPEKGQMVIDGERATLREMLLFNVWQTLINNPNMTATQALIVSDEKGDLLGPTGSKIQHGLSRVFDRETGIMGRKGAFEGEFAPDRIAASNFGLRFTSPLDRLRRAKELVGAKRVWESTLEAARIDPRALARFDPDAYIKLSQDVTEAPTGILRSDEDYEAKLEEMDQQQAMMANLQAAQAAGAAAKQGGEGMRAAREAIQPQEAAAQ